MGDLIKVSEEDIRSTLKALFHGVPVDMLLGEQNRQEDPFFNEYIAKMNTLIEDSTRKARCGMVSHLLRGRRKNGDRSSIVLRGLP